jgi:hypothetical protein
MAEGMNGEGMNGRRSKWGKKRIEEAVKKGKKRMWKGLNVQRGKWGSRV